MNAGRTLAATALCGVMVFCGCSHPMAEYESSLVAGDYAKAVSIATEEIPKSGNDELMWRLMAGGASRLAGDCDAAIAQFDEAEDIMAEHDSSSVFAKGSTSTWAMLTNDKAFPYDGGGQDRIMTCLYKAIDFAAIGKPDAARTELNRAAMHQENWLYERRREIASAQKRLESDVATYKRDKNSTEGAAPKNKQGSMVPDSNQFSNEVLGNSGFMSQVKEKSGFDMATGGVLDNLQPADWMNPYASHVTGVFRWLNGDECRNYFKESLDCSGGNPTVARDFADVEQEAKPQNQVWIWLEDGLGPKRDEWRIDLPLGIYPWLNKYVFYAGMALPNLVFRQTAGDGWHVGASQMHELVDMDAKIKTEFDVYFRGALYREVTRAVIKTGSQIALGVIAESKDDLGTKYTLKASQVAAAAWAAATVRADTRSWMTLPKKVHVVRIDRPEDGKVILSGSCGDFPEIVVPPGNSMVFISKPSVMAPPSYKIVTYP